MPRLLRVRLSNGDVRHLDVQGYEPHIAMVGVHARQPPFSGDLLPTIEGTLVARDHIAEMYEVQSDGVSQVDAELIPLEEHPF